MHAKLKENSCVEACKAVFCMFGVKYNHLRAKSGRLDSFWRSFDNAALAPLASVMLYGGIRQHTLLNLLHRSKQHQTYLVGQEKSLSTSRSGPESSVHRMSFIQRIFCPSVSMGADQTNRLPSTRSFVGCREK